MRTALSLRALGNPRCLARGSPGALRAWKRMARRSRYPIFLRAGSSGRRARTKDAKARRGVGIITRVKKLLVSLCATGMLFGIAAPASAQQQDGLVNVIVGDITIRDAVDIGVAAQVAANVCGVKVGPVAVLARQVDRSGDTRTVCTTDQGDVTLTQN
jgi:hypothetical protein